ncbi:MAG: Hsp20/alpha crystallin family protein [bacterium]|nr:Hsp20/alpha crystallin family protein [bacterium]
MNTSNKKIGFWERITGSIRAEEENGDSEKLQAKNNKKDKGGWMEEESSEAELAVDVYQTPTDIMIQTMVAGVRPEDLDLDIARDVISIHGKREENRTIDEENYFTKELYWGKFSRTILLPQEVEPEEAEATEKHGLLTIRLQKVDKGKKNTIKVKSI